MACESTLMEEEEDSEKEPTSSSQPSILEVQCNSCGRIRLFACGTDAGFAVYLINSKLGFGVPPALYIEAVKEGEEPISFGPKATLVNYGEGWKLQTVTEGGYEAASQNQQTSKIPLESRLIGNPAARGSEAGTSYGYFAKILMAFASMFLLAGSLVYFLENLPWLIKLVIQS